LAYDFCVRFTAEDARKLGSEVYIVKDACRPVGLPGSIEAAEKAFADLGITVC